MQAVRLRKLDWYKGSIFILSFYSFSDFLFNFLMGIIYIYFVSTCFSYVETPIWLVVENRGII